MENTLQNSKQHFTGLFGTAFALLSIFFIVPVFEKNFCTHFALQCSFILLILSTLYTIYGRRIILFSGVLFFAPFLCFDSLSFLYRSSFFMTIAYVFSTVFTLMSIIVLMKKILRSNYVNASLIFAALMVYLLSGVLWANFYFIENMWSPGSFHGAGSINFNHAIFDDSYEQQFNFLYYSFATLATLGMGDITPLSHLAKSLTAMEAMFGQLFVAIIIAKLVSVWWHVPTIQAVKEESSQNT